MYKNVIRMANANQGRKANTFPEIDTLADDSAFFVLQKIGGVRKARQLTKEAFALQFGEMFNHPIVVTYTDLLNLANDNDLKLGVKYLITNATAANINLEVEAIATNQIHCDAKDPLYPNDKVMYNFASNVITWRWDTVRDVSAGEDWRNSNNIQIPDSCTRITIGVLSSNIILGEVVANIKIGDLCTNITIPIDCSNIEIEDVCSNIILSEAASFKKICSGTDGYNFATATNFYNITSYAEVRLTQSGGARMNYYDGDGNFVSVAP